MSEISPRVIVWLVFAIYFKINKYKNILDTGVTAHVNKLETTLKYKWRFRNFEFTINLFEFTINLFTKTTQQIVEDIYFT